MFQNLGGLKNFFHVVALGSEVKKGKYLKRMFYSIPLLIFRDKKGNVRIFLDVCVHKRAPLNFVKNEIVCPYHGWKFEEDGSLKEIPSSPHLKGKLDCKLKKFVSKEKYGFIWIYPNEEEIKNEIPKIDNNFNNNWKHFWKKKIFETNDDLLIENFMDATHTPIAHNGLIRSKSTKTKHEINIKEFEDKIEAEFAETQENVGLGINYLIGKKLKIKHTDLFLLPNFVKVNYKVNDIERFQAFIACTQIENGKTMGFFMISYNFGFFLNFILKLILPFVAFIVLKQDFKITKDQFENMKYFPEIKENHIDYDSLYTKVKILKEKFKNSEKVENKKSEIKINIYV